MTIIGAYLFGETLQEWTPDDTRTQLQKLKSYGVNTIFSEADSYPSRVIDIAHDLGLRFMGGLTCFQSKQAYIKTPAYRPITLDGQPRPPMNWYHGITPTHTDYQQGRLDALTSMLNTYQLDGVWLDFIRWAMHWEVELRDDTPLPLQSGFDEHTLHLFSEWSDITLPQTDTAKWILQHHRDRWADFKCHVITDFVGQVRDIQTAHNETIPLGINIVPSSTSQRRQLLGQDVTALSAHADIFSPMVYHHILGRDPAWIQDTLDSIADDTEKPLIPFVQVRSLDNPDETDFPAQEWEQVIQTVLTHPQTDGLIAFTGSHLHHVNRGVNLAEVVNQY